MAVTTRFYPNFSGAAFQPTTPRGAWDKTSDADPPCQLSRTKSGTEAVTTTTEVSATNNYDTLWEVLVSDPFTAPVSFTASDTLQWVLGVLENNASANAFWHVHAYITAGDTNTVRGTILTDNIGATEFTTALTGRGEGTKALGSVSASIGDRLVVEIGAQFQNTSTSSFSAQVALQGTGGTDLTQGSTSVSTQPGWIQLVSATDPFGAAGSSTGSATGAATAAGVGAADSVSTGSATGLATAAGIGASLIASVGAATGAASAIGAGSSAFAGTGTALGISSVVGMGASVAVSVGAATGLASSAGIGASNGQTTGTALGVATASGVTPGGVSAATGTAIGVATAFGITPSVVAAGIGTAIGEATAFGIGFASRLWTPIVITPTNWLPQAIGSSPFSPVEILPTAWTEASGPATIWTPALTPPPDWTPQN